jgi:hypothetical protein
MCHVHAAGHDLRATVNLCVTGLVAVIDVVIRRLAAVAAAVRAGREVRGAAIAEPESEGNGRGLVKMGEGEEWVQENGNSRGVPRELLVSLVLSSVHRKKARRCRGKRKTLSALSVRMLDGMNIR